MIRPALLNSIYATIRPALRNSIYEYLVCVGESRLKLAACGSDQRKTVTACNTGCETMQCHVTAAKKLTSVKQSDCMQNNHEIAQCAVSQNTCAKLRASSIYLREPHVKCTNYKLSANKWRHCKKNKKQQPMTFLSLHNTAFPIPITHFNKQAHRTSKVTTRGAAPRTANFTNLKTHCLGFRNCNNNDGATED